jgi:type VI secretion system secreted protein VgrG
VNLNSGGSAGSGSGFGGQGPLTPDWLKNGVSVAELAQPNITATQVSGEALVQVMPKSINYLFSA